MDNNSLTENVPNNSLLFMSFTPTFGNLAFQIDPVGRQGTDMQNNFPTIPYLSLEALLYQQMSSNPLTSSDSTLSGSNTGQQVIGGQISQQDANGTNRFQQGFQSSQG